MGCCTSKPQTVEEPSGAPQSRVPGPPAQQQRAPPPNRPPARASASHKPKPSTSLRPSANEPSQEEKRAKMAEAAEARMKQQDMRGIHNPKTAQKLKTEQTSKPTYEDRRTNDLVQGWGS
ncbi:hypothetical protein CYMTET_7785 [Cymbomonas tetramitiformis]|uniref:Small VCP/p97-interacting protein n=1 Tax=Cymbomonas tetramitiformis TaxID=36881 RepID=A0AAE0GUC3_9CHLO|nr:hypothetical protein CYMTET_7785 [Cymbomonas tetramitiformis]